MKLPLAVLTLLLPLLLAACGDGTIGGPVLPAQTADEEAARIEEILEGCALEQVENARALAETLEAIYARGEVVPVVGLDGLPTVTESQLVIPFTLDVDANGKVDGTGVLTLLDAEGNPTNPFDLVTLIGLLAGGVDALPDALALLPDDTFVAIRYDGYAVLVGSGDLLVRFVGGAPVGVSGGVTVPTATCSVTLQFDEVAVPDPEATSFEPVTVQVRIESGGDVVSGEVLLDEGPTAAATLALNGGTSFDFEIDWTTGAVTRL